jgi:glycine/D-amino acid oxidase-like deaminating enzyme
MKPIEEACYWLATCKPQPEPSWAGDGAADAVVIGGGYTGLWTALFLRELDPSLSVVLLEQAVTGYGASGRNAGQVSACLDHSHRKAIAHFGLDEARRMAQVGLDNFRQLETFLRENQVACDFLPTGQLNMALTPSHEHEVADMVVAAESVGVSGYRYLSAEETRAELNSPLYRGSVFDPSWATVNPAKLVAGLKRVAKMRSVTVCERSPVTRLRRGSPGIIVTTAGGEVRAGSVILATNAYTHLIYRKPLRRYLPLYDYILVSEPLTAAQKAEIGWVKRQAVVDARAFFNYYRLTADDRILWGGSQAVYYAGNRVGPEQDQSPFHIDRLRAGFQRHFPMLEDLTFPYAWGGPICSTTRLTPFFGTAARGQVVYGLGYTGLGTANARLAGRILAHMALRCEHPLLDLAMVKRLPFPYPPEPLRSLAVRAVASSLRRVDEGEQANVLLRVLDRMGIGFSS